jgi:hypothetical protein
MLTLEIKNYPEIKAAILAAFPGYRKQKVFVSEFGSHGKTINSYWDGGSRSEFGIVHLETRQRKNLPTGTHPYFDVAAKGLTNSENDAVSVDSRGNVTLKILPDGYALIEAGTFCGKPATAHLYLNAANMAKLLPAK